MLIASRHQEPPLTSGNRPLAEMAAVELALSRGRGEEPAQIGRYAAAS